MRKSIIIDFSSSVRPLLLHRPTRNPIIPLFILPRPVVGDSQTESRLPRVRQSGRPPQHGATWRHPPGTSPRGSPPFATGHQLIALRSLTPCPTSHIGTSPPRSLSFVLSRCTLLQHSDSLVAISVKSEREIPFALLKSAGAASFAPCLTNPWPLQVSIHCFGTPSRETVSSFFCQAFRYQRDHAVV